MTATALLGPYAGFIVTAYAAAIAIVAALILWIVLDRRHLIRVIADIEAQGAPRRPKRSREEKP
jgi:heme exporter protein CcmD